MIENEGNTIRGKGGDLNQKKHQGQYVIKKNKKKTQGLCEKNKGRKTHVEARHR